MKAEDNPFPHVTVAEGAAPSSPSAGDQLLFIDSADHKLKRKDSSGTVTTIEGGGGGSGTVTSVTAGDGTVTIGGTSTDPTVKATVGTASGTVAAGDDSRITGAVQKSTATTKGDILVASASATVGRHGVGSDGQVLTADSTQTDGVKWATPASGFADPTTTKGDLITHGTTTGRKAVGSDGQALFADSTQTDGLIWRAVAESDVTNLTTDLAAKAPLASPALTGTPTAPTAASGANSTQIATTAYVDSAIAAGGGGGGTTTGLDPFLLMGA